MEPAEQAGSSPANRAAKFKDDPLPPLYLVGALFLLVIGAGAGALALYDPADTLPISPEGFAVFAPIFFAAQAIERLLEPIAARVLTTSDEKDKVKETRETKLRAMAVERGVIEVASRSADEPTVDDTAVKEQEALHKLRRKRAVRTLVWWAVASIVGLLVAGALGLGILQAMGAEDAEWTPRQQDLDILLTGLVIGAGTKPLHDLIARLEKSKANSDPATKPTSQLPGTPGAAKA